ncbi:MAG: glycoside hydrolase family 88 protein, partial [Acidobacteriota bacterium]|nr:glycoside hydrolase family 88 protein [Acidobacteriota bacterium]
AASSAPSPSFPPPGGFFDGKLDPTPHYIWRWTTMQAPTIVIEVRSAQAAAWQANGPAATLVSGAGPAPEGSLAAALEGSGTGPAWSMPVPALRLDVSAGGAVPAIRDVLSRAATLASPLRAALTTRQSRAPLDVARLLAPKYPAQAIMSYIPALAWSGALRLARLTGETRFRDKPLSDMAPFLSGEKPAIAEPYLLTSLAGHLAFSDLGELDGDATAAALARKGADFILPQAPGEIVRFPRAWTDDMFMATSVLARVGARTNDDRYGAAAGRLLTGYASDLQRADGIFIHAKEGPYAWGRGNGFAAFGLMEALTYIAAPWPDRSLVLASYRAHMKGLVAHQAADGMWRQVVDEPGSYRELTVTAMVLTAMARGVRLGWLDASYRPVVDRAWRGLLARIAEDGTLMDVCTGTGSGPTKDYYLNRAGITGADDRGGAMALTAALEMEELARAAARR